MGKYMVTLGQMPVLNGAHPKILLGGKGAGLWEMRELMLPVPPAFVITTDAWRAYQKAGASFFEDEEFQEEIIQAMMWLQEQTNTIWCGNPVGPQYYRPLLVSVRSGAPVSMPGMMDTFLNIGLTQQILDNVPPHTLKRLNPMWSRLRDSFLKIDQPVPGSPWKQLRIAIESVFKSWDSPRAREYRKNFNIPDALGTAVTVQAMVCGIGEHSGTGVIFTRNPNTGDNEIYGEWLHNAQGEDLVNGEHTPLDISVFGKTYPQQAEQLVKIAELLEQHYGDMQDIEFTLDDGILYILQCRSGKRTARAEAQILVDMVEEGLLSRAQAVARADMPRIKQFALRGYDPKKYQTLATGLGCGGGIVSGRLITTPAYIEQCGAEEPLILFRDETTPQDIKAMIAAAGIVTKKGGATSHAAVVARQLGKPAVVGIGNAAKAVEQYVVDYPVSLDGDRGLVLKGVVKSETVSLPSAIKTLLQWAKA